MTPKQWQHRFQQSDKNSCQLYGGNIFTPAECYFYINLFAILVATDIWHSLLFLWRCIFVSAPRAREHTAISINAGIFATRCRWQQMPSITGCRDTTSENGPERLKQLIRRTGGMQALSNSIHFTRLWTLLQRENAWLGAWVLAT